MGTKRPRRIGEGPAPVTVTEETVEEDMRALLHQIHGFYEAALGRLPAEEIPSLAPRLLTAGFCFGVLDPVSNIIANTVSYCPLPNPNEETQPHTTRESVMSRIITDTDDDDVFDLLLPPETAERMTVARRSLEGLVSFLIFYFRYLAETEALRYLRLAGADLLAAVRLIELDRHNSVDPQDGKPGFSVVSLTTKVALGCAAVSAKHPDPDTFVRASRLLAARLKKVSKLLPAQDNGCCLSSVTLKRIDKLLKREHDRSHNLTNLCYHRPLELAGSRYQTAKIRKMEQLLASGESIKKKKKAKKKRKLNELLSAKSTEGRTKKRKMELLPSGDSVNKRKAKKRKMVLQAFVDSIKAKKKRKLKELLSAESEEGRKGIQATFRYTQTLKLMLLDRIHAHYLEALARLPGDLLRKVYHSSLLRAGFSYGSMDPASNIIINTIWYATAFPTHDAFEVAMISTKKLRRLECCSLYGLVAFIRCLFNTLSEHDAVWFLIASDADVRLAINLVEEEGHILSGFLHEAYKSAALHSSHPSPDKLVKLTMSPPHEELFFLLDGRALLGNEVEQLAMSLSPKGEEKVSQSDHAEMLCLNQQKFMEGIRKKFQVDQEFFVNKINSTLRSYARKSGDHFEIHIICGVNPNVNKGTYSHINFWAIPKASNNADNTPVLFFAQCNNEDGEEEEEESFCCPVSPACIDSFAALYLLLALILSVAFTVSTMEPRLHIRMMMYTMD